MKQNIYLGFFLMCILLIQGCVHSQMPDNTSTQIPSSPKTVQLAGFSTSPYWNEQVKTYNYDTDVRIQINAPSVKKYDRSKPTELILYLLPNGNSIEQTVGKKLKPGDDWHFNIQHIGAQTRRLREVMTDRNIVIAYLEATPKSWPSYSSRHPDAPQQIQKIIQSIIAQLSKQPEIIVLSSHSGGGSFVFNFINSQDHIPDWIDRLSFLESVYNYSTTKGHDVKLIEWLKSDPKHCLSVITYRDYDITLNGKKVAGTISFKKTHEMIDSLSKEFPLSVTTTGDYVRWEGLNGQIDIINHLNPENKILHTVLVEKNGFIHSMTVGTQYENKAGIFWTDHAYDQWIQE